MSERQPYSRVYWSIRTDPKFDAIYGDDRHLAAWLRLLIAADATWPAPADVPATARKASLQALSEAQLIDLLPSGMFKVRGLDAERGRRRDAAQTGAERRWGPGANGVQTDTERRPNGMLAKPSQAEDEPRQAEGEAPRAPDPAQIYWNLTGRYPRDKALSWIDDIASSYGPEPVIRALAKCHIEDSSVSTLLGRTEDVLRSEARTLSLKEQATVRSQLKERRAEPPPDPAAVQAELEKILRGEAA